ncbi:hypothetical protein [Gordonia paraffinivorans]|uniref:hypothetical protein n=1 Tax=Gordonia paraffinivorans TaxID=175628 RepID=UPI003C6CDE91
MSLLPLRNVPFSVARGFPRAFDAMLMTTSGAMRSAGSIRSTVIPLPILCDGASTWVPACSGNER